MRTKLTLKLVAVLLCCALICPAQKAKKNRDPESAPAPATATMEDISGMYNFLKDGEFVQINMDSSGVSGYISREGDLESDRGEFLDQFFSKAVIHGHQVSFTTRPIHGVWFEFKGRYDRGPARTKAEDAYYILRGTLMEFRTDATNKATSRAREVEFKSLAQPDESSR